MARHKPLLRESGQATVEFAFVLPLLLLIMLGIFQVGIVLRDYLSLTDAVRVGARQAAVSRTASDPATAVRNAVVAASDLDPQRLRPRVQVVSTWQPGSAVTVTAAYPYSLNILGLVVRSGDLTTKTTSRVE